MLKKLIDKLTNYLPTRTVVFEHNPNKTLKLRIENSVRSLMLQSPITDWEEGYNNGVEDALEKIKEVNHEGN